METYLDVMKWGEERLGVKLLTPEYEITSMLFDVERITPLTMRQQFSGSNANFSNILRSLEAKGVVRSEANPSDRRSKLYRLSDRALSILARQWAHYTKRVDEELAPSGNPIKMIRNYSLDVTQQLKIRQFTCEYQTLMYLNLNPGLTSIACCDLVEVSNTKFNNCMKSLVDSGFTFHVPNPADRREKLYHLSDEKRKVMDALSGRVLAWFDSKMDFFETLLRNVR